MFGAESIEFYHMFIVQANDVTFWGHPGYRWVPYLLHVYGPLTPIYDPIYDPYLRSPHLRPNVYCVSWLYGP